MAGFGDRLLARLVDSLAYLGVCAVLAVPAFIAFMYLTTTDLVTTPSPSAPYDPNMGGLLLGTLGIGAASTLPVLMFSYVYEVEMALRTGQTLGKRAARIRVVPAAPAGPPSSAGPVGGAGTLGGAEPGGLATQGRRLRRKTAAMRFLCLAVGGTYVPCFALVDGLWQLWDRPRRQCLHDKFAGTVVVKDPPKIVLAGPVRYDF